MKNEYEKINLSYLLWCMANFRQKIKCNLFEFKTNNTSAFGIIKWENSKRTTLICTNSKLTRFNCECKRITKKLSET